MTSSPAMTLVLRVHLALYALSPNTAPAFNLAMVISLGLFFCSLSAYRLLSIESCFKMDPPTLASDDAQLELRRDGKLLIVSGKRES
jgi:hypothetical protein